MSPVRLIKRYGNRKLYDVAARAYVTLDDVAGLVARREEVEVRNQRSGEDVTAPTLAQAILEGLKEGKVRIPGQVLAHLIRLGVSAGAAWGDFLGPREAAAQARDEAERIAGKLLARGRLTLEEALALRQEVGQSVQRIVAEAQSGLEGRIRKLLAPAPASASLGGLKDRLGTLEKALARPRTKRGKPRKKTA